MSIEQVCKKPRRSPSPAYNGAHLDIEIDDARLQQAMTACYGNIFKNLSDFFAANVELSAKSVGALYTGLLSILPNEPEGLSVLLKAMSYSERKGFKWKYLCQFKGIEKHFELALTESVQSFQGLHIPEKAWWAATRPSAKLILPEGSMDALFQHDGGSWEALEADLLSVVSHEAGCRIFDFAVSLLRHEKMHSPVLLAIGELKKLRTVTSGALDANMAWFLATARDSGIDPFQPYSDACSVNILYHDEWMKMVAHSGFDHYRLAVLAHIRSTGVAQGLLVKLPHERPGRQRAQIHMELLVAANICRGAFLNASSDNLEEALRKHAAAFEGVDDGFRIDAQYLRLQEASAAENAEFLLALS
jgi:hypothetical protein